MTLDELLAKFDVVRDEADGYLVPCPAHADSHPSLKITRKDDGKILMVCRAGCSQSDVMTAVSALGVNIADLQGMTPGTAVRRSAASTELVGPRHVAALRLWLTECAAYATTATMEYASRRFGIDDDHWRELELGTSDPSHSAPDFVGTSFSRRTRLVVPFIDFDGIVRGAQGRDIDDKDAARWSSLKNLGDAVWLRYTVLRNETGYDTWVVCEGPGDALTAYAAGYNVIGVRGASLVRNKALIATFAQHLVDADVVLAGDRDKAGEAFTEHLAEALSREGVMVRRLAIPRAGWDVTDWRTHHTDTFVSEFHAAVRSAVPYVSDQAFSVHTEKGTDGAQAASSTDVELTGTAREIFDLTDVGIACQLRDYLNGGVKYTPGLGFLTWNGHVWAVGDHVVRESLHRMGAEMLAKAESDAAKKRATRALSNRSITQILAELPSVPGVRCDADDFDRNPDLLAVRNGTINLRTGVLSPHNPDDMITQLVNVDYDPNAQCPRWDRFIEEVFPHHPDLPAFMRRLVGYGITGYTSEQCFAFMHGSGKNGKSKFLEAIAFVFKGVTAATEFTTFEQRVSVGQASPELARLRGHRLVMANETEKFTRLAESLVKQLTGGDPVTARFLNKNPFTYTPKFLLMVAGNYKPAIISSDEGIWRRVRLIPWEATFRGSAADIHLSDKLRAEAPGILAWTVRGAQEWFVDGLADPESVQTATNEYRQSEDRLAEFLETLVIEPTARIAPTPLRLAYKTWADDAGISNREILNGWTLGQELEGRGFKKGKDSRGRYFAGLRLPTEAESRMPVGGDTDIFNQRKEGAR